VEHLLRTQASDEPMDQRRRGLQATCRQVRWLRLEILATDAGGPSDLVGTVTFRAHYRQGAASGVLEECSRFGRSGDRTGGAWLYLEALALSDGAAD
jgi:SEC-C motif-containing protein